MYAFLWMQPSGSSAGILRGLRKDSINIPEPPASLRLLCRRENREGYGYTYGIRENSRKIIKKIVKNCQNFIDKLYWYVV